MIEKIEITQNYTFSRYYSFNTEFVIDFIDNLALPMLKIKYISNTSNNGHNKDKLIKSKNLILT